MTDKRYSKDELEALAHKVLKRNYPDMLPQQRDRLLAGFEHWVLADAVHLSRELTPEDGIIRTLASHARQTPELFRAPLSLRALVLRAIDERSRLMGRPATPEERINCERSVHDLTPDQRIAVTESLSADEYASWAVPATQLAAKPASESAEDVSGAKLFRNMSPAELDAAIVSTLGEKPRMMLPSERQKAVAYLKSLDPIEAEGPDPRAALAAKARGGKGVENWTAADRISAQRAGEVVPPNAGSALFTHIEKPVPRS